MRLGLIGRGRMGSEVERLALLSGHQIDLTLDSRSNAGGSGLTPKNLEGIDAVIDFSAADCVLDNVRRVADAGVPMVEGTTGWYGRLEEVRRAVEASGSALVYSSNFSIGAHLFFELAKAAAVLFDRFDTYDPYVFEHHHRGKADAPSGTALRLADIVLAGTERKTEVHIGNLERPIASEALHVSSLRAGGAYGRHVLGFDGAGDSLEIEHRACSREGFARGALHAAAWLRNKKGVHEFANVVAGGT